MDYYKALSDRHASRAGLAVADASMAAHAALDRALDGIRAAGRQEGRVLAAEKIAAAARDRERQHGLDEYTQGLWHGWHAALGEDIASP